jgi:gamma-glutamyltranspeptidase/glutathione hydrolase
VCVPTYGLTLKELGARSPQFWHLLVEAKKLAYADLHRYNADPRQVNVPVERLISKEYAATLCDDIDPAKASTPPDPTEYNGGTIYLAAADRWGNIVSFIHSSYDYFGSGLTVPGYGFLLHNRGALFSLDPDSPNVVAPNKRPFNTLIPGFITKDGKPLLAFGNMGGSVQVQAQAKEVIDMVDLGMNPQASTDSARFSHSQGSNRLQLESNLFGLVGDELKAMGHDAVSASGSPMGGFQAVLFSEDPDEPKPRVSRQGTRDSRPVNGVYRAGSDHRKDRQAVGW